MPSNRLGPKGPKVSVLGFGAMHLNDERTSEAEASTLLNTVLDLGITLIDTAPSYGLSEARIGRHLSHRRQAFVLSTKLGYGVDGVPDWTAECITQGVERALRLMRTDCIDIAHLHSCPAERLQRGDLQEALRTCRQAGKIRMAAYSGDGDALALALQDPTFDSVQCSLSLCDRANQALLSSAPRPVGVLAKRPLAGAVWRWADDMPPQPTSCGPTPATRAEDAYAQRWQAMRQLRAKPLNPLSATPDPHALALRWAVYHAGADAVLVGTRTLQNLRSNVQALVEGPLDPETLQLLDALYQEAQLHDARRGVPWTAWI